MPDLKSFVETLKDIRQGAVIGDLTADLGDLVAAVRATGSGGKLTLTLEVKPASKGDVNVLMIRDTVKLTLPRSQKASTILFATEENVLQRNDPRQPELKGLRQVATVATVFPNRVETPPERAAGDIENNG